MRVSRYIGIIVLVLIAAHRGVAQFFDEGEPSLADFRSLGVGGAQQSFTARPGNPEADSARIRIAHPLWLAEYRQLGLRLALGYSSYKFRNDSRSEFTISAESGTDISLSGGPEKGNLYLPILFATNYVQATGITNSTKDFNVADIGVGTGLSYRQISQDVGFQVSGVGLIYYSSAGFSLQSGSSTAAIGELQFLFRELIGQGLTVGYRIEVESWSMSDKTLNYTREIQGPFVGIFF